MTSVLPGSQLFLIQEVQNYGGFFGGETLTLIAKAWQQPDAEEQTFTIDAHALTNVAERYNVVAGMLLKLSFAAGGRVEHAELLAASSREDLRQALGTTAIPERLDGPLVISSYCASCGLWVAGQSAEGLCGLCGRSRELRS